MEGKKTRGKQKIEMKQIEGEDRKLVTFSKRKSGIYKKTNELATLCGADIGIILFSPCGKPFSFANSSIESITNRFINENPPQGGAYSRLEAFRQKVIDELNEKHNALFHQLEAEKIRGKMLKQLKEEKNCDNGWWENTVEELNVEEAKDMKTSLTMLRKYIYDHFSEKKIGALSLDRL